MELLSKLRAIQIRGKYVEFLDPETFWISFSSPGLIRDSVSTALRIQAEELLSSALFAKMCGFDRFKTDYRIFYVSHSHDESSDKTRTFQVYIEAVNPQIINSWIVNIGPGVTEDWNEVVRKIEESSRAIAKLSWLKDWRSKDEGKVITFDLDHPFAPIVDREKTQKKWERSDLPGKVEFGVYLRQKYKDTLVQYAYKNRFLPVATVAFSSQSKEALVLEARESSGSHWLDRISFDVALHDEDRIFGVVNAEGNFKLKGL